MQTNNKTFDTSHELGAAPDLKKLTTAKPINEMRQANEALELLSARRLEELAGGKRERARNALQITSEELSEKELQVSSNSGLA